MAKNRLVRQKPIEAEDDEKDLGADVALVGGSDDGIVVTDEDDANPKNLETEDEDWDDQGKAKDPDKDKAIAAREGGAEEDEEDDLRTAYDEEEDGSGTDRRPSRRSRRNRAKRDAISARDAEIQQLRGAVSTLMERFQQLQGGHLSMAASTIETQLASASQALSLADDALADAVKEGDGAKFREVQALRDEAAQRVMALRGAQARIRAMPPPNERLNGQGNGQDRQQQQPTPQQQEAAQNAERMANIFLDRNPWFDPEGKDRESRLARQIDEELAAEGYQTHTKAFWQEFERRCKEAELGADYEDEEDERPIRRAPAQRRNGGGLPPTGAVRSSSRPGRGGFTLSTTQVDLLREEGLDGDKLSDADRAKKDRIIARWKQGAAQQRRQRA